MEDRPVPQPLELPYCPADERAICVRDVTMRFGRETAVDGVTFDVPRGAIFGYIGPSGSGKTTTIRMVTGVLRPTEGEIIVLGRDPARFTQTMREQIGYMPQHFVLYPGLTVRQNLNFAASLYGLGLRRGRRLRDVLSLVELDGDAGKLARDISGGMQRRLALAATLVHSPELIFLDEPTAGIDPVLRRKFWDHFRQLRDEGHTLFITTQYVGETAYCDLVGVMNEGRLIVVDTPDGLRRRALGGDLVDLHVAEALDYTILQRLDRLPYVRRLAARLDDHGVRLVVDEAKTAVPALLDWCRESGLAVASIEEYAPPFDDIFVELVARGKG